MKCGAHVLLTVNLLLASATAQATLYDRGHGLIYDDGLNVTWASNANINGLMDWNTAVTWAANLVYAGYSDWRLPTVSPVDPTKGFDYTNWASDGLHDLSYNITSKNSEMSYLYYVELGNNGYLSTNNAIQSDYGLIRTTPFTNMQSYGYWSQTGAEHGGDSGNAWGFDTSVGLQEAPNKATMLFALAVREGDISSVPEPTSLVLTGLALAGVGAVRRRKTPTP